MVKTNLVVDDVTLQVWSHHLESGAAAMSCRLSKYQGRTVQLKIHSAVVDFYYVA